MQSITILHLEDSLLDAELTSAALLKDGLDFQIVRVDTREDFRHALERPDIQVILADYSLPNFDGLAALEIARTRRPDLPFIFLSGTLGEEVAVNALRNGAIDYVLKRNLPRLGPSIRRAVKEANARAKQAQAEHDLRLSEERFRVAVKNSPLLVYTTDRKLRITWMANAPAELSALDLIGKRIDELLPAAHVADLMQLSEQVLQSGRGSRQEIQIQFGREPGIYDVTAEVFTSEQGEAAGLTVAAMDITARRQNEKELQLSRERMNLVLEASQLGLWYCDLPFDRLQWNAKVKEHFFIPPEVDVTIDLFYERLHPEDRERTRHAIETSIQNGTQFDIDYRTVAPDGREKYIRAIGQPFFRADGTPERFDGISIDITQRMAADHERERLLDATAKAKDEAEAANRMKDHFLATLSHELRTPLNAIVGWAQLIRIGKLDEEKLKHGLSVIERNASLQTQLIDDLLDVSRIISGKLRLQIEQVKLQDVVKAALESVSPAATSKGVVVHCELDENAPAIPGDAARLQQVAWNLLSNAVKFTPAGGKVHVRCRSLGTHLKLEVSDTGEGIKPEFLPFVFDRFRQAETVTTTRLHGGLGLGLSIVRQLVELHGGTVRVASDGQGYGSRFTVMLPITVAPVLDVESTATQRLVSPPSLDFQCDSGLDGIRILVVDDERDAQDLLSRLLSTCRAETATASSADEAIRMLELFRPHVMISDIGMPHQDGYELIRRTRLQYPAVKLPAIALTAFARAEDRQRALEAGFQSHITKPVDAAELIRVLSSLVCRDGQTPSCVRDSISRFSSERA